MVKRLVNLLQAQRCSRVNSHCKPALRVMGVVAVKLQRLADIAARQRAEQLLRDNISKSGWRCCFLPIMMHRSLNYGHQRKKTTQKNTSLISLHAGSTLMRIHRTFFK